MASEMDLDVETGLLLASDRSPVARRERDNPRADCSPVAVVAIVVAVVLVYAAVACAHTRRCSAAGVANAATAFALYVLFYCACARCLPQVLRCCEAIDAWEQRRRARAAL